MSLKIFHQGCDMSQFPRSRAVTGLENEVLSSPLFQTEGPQDSHGPEHRASRQGKGPLWNTQGEDTVVGI